MGKHSTAAKRVKVEAEEQRFTRHGVLLRPLHVQSKYTREEIREALRAAMLLAREDAAKKAQ